MAEDRKAVRVFLRRRLGHLDAIRVPARRMDQRSIDSTRIHLLQALLGAVRGSPPADRAALAELIARLSRFAADHAELIEEIDLNPVIVHPQGQGLTVVDALIVKRSPEENCK